MEQKCAPPLHNTSLAIPLWPRSRCDPSLGLAQLQGGCSTAGPDPAPRGGQLVLNPPPPGSTVTSAPCSRGQGHGAGGIGVSPNLRSLQVRRVGGGGGGGGRQRPAQSHSPADVCPHTKTRPRSCTPTPCFFWGPRWGPGFPPAGLPGADGSGRRKGKRWGKAARLCAEVSYCWRDGAPLLRAGGSSRASARQ